MMMILIIMTTLIKQKIEQFWCWRHYTNIVLQYDLQIMKILKIILFPDVMI